MLIIKEESIMKDIRDDLFYDIRYRNVTACLYADSDGIISGIANALAAADDIGLTVDYSVIEGTEIMAGDLIMQISGSPKHITMAEDRMIGKISKFSGVATAARTFAKKAGNRIRVVCGSWKKMPEALKQDLRIAAGTGGVYTHILNEPMIYMDKNYVAMFGGIQAALMAASKLGGRKKVVQICGRYENGDIVREAWTAIRSGADIVFIDTGKIEDLKAVTEALKPIIHDLEESGGYRKVEFAYAGGIHLSEMEDLINAGADAIDVGRSICDAPLLDLHLEVTNVEDPESVHADYNLLDKSELKIEGIYLEQANLTELAAIVAEEIGIRSEDVLVIDVRDGAVALDILQKQLDPKQFIAKESFILERIGKLPNVKLIEDAHISSQGMLGWIAGDTEQIEEGQKAIEESRELAFKIRENISKRVIVFPTGAEVEHGEIEDTNTPLIMKCFEDAGFAVDKGNVLKDDIMLFSRQLLLAAEQGYGISITTGGVGAENKDFSVEAIQLLDKHARTPYIAKFHQGHGRHSKDGIRIAVGQMGLTTYIALPGPNDEVALCIDTVVRGVSEGWSKEILAEEIAVILRNRLKEKIGIKPDQNYHHGD